MKFTLKKTERTTKARLGELETAHGKKQTNKLKQDCANNKEEVDNNSFEKPQTTNKEEVDNKQVNREEVETNMNNIPLKNK